MRNALTNGVLPVYKDLREQLRANNDRYGLIGDERRFLPFSFYLPDGGEVSDFLAVPTSGGDPVSLDTSLINRYVDEEGGSYYVYPFADSGTTFCGSYMLAFNIGGSTYYTAVMLLNPLCVDEAAVIATASRQIVASDDPDNPGPTYNYQFTYADTAGNIISSLTECRGATGWVAANPVARLKTNQFVARRTIETSCGISVSHYWVNDTTVTLIGQSTRPHKEGEDIWEFTFSDTGSFDGIPYQLPYEQKAYLKMTFAEPVPTTEADYWTNGNGVEFLNFANTTERVAALAVDIPDFMRGPLISASHCKTITARRLLTGITYDVQGLSFTFSRQNEGSLSTASVEWVRNHYHADAVNEQLQIIAT